MARRLQLQGELTTLLGSSNVYYQPPESVKIKYPCFIYNNNPGDVQYADNKMYKYDARYDLMYITREADHQDFVKKILRNFEMIDHDRSYRKDNLYHEVFDLYY